MSQTQENIEAGEAEKNAHSAFMRDHIGLFSWWRSTDEKNQREFVICQRWLNKQHELQVIELLEKNTGKLIQVPYLQFYQNVKDGLLARSSPVINDLPPPVPHDLYPDRFC